MKITLKGFGKESETISSDYRVNSESMDWNVKGFDESKKGRDDAVLKSLWNLYLTDETAFAVVQSISMLALGEKYEIEGIPEKSPEHEDLVRSFNRTWPSLYGIIRDTLIFGNSFSKIIKNRVGKFHNLEVLHPLDVTKEVIGDEIKYTYQKKIFKEEEIFENVFFRRPDSIYGISLLSPVKAAIERKRSLETNIATAIQRHMPRFSISVSPNSMGRYPSEDERKAIGKEFKKLSSDQEFVHTNLIDIDVIDTKSTIPSLEAYTMFTLNSILIGTNVPAEIVGAITRSGTFASSKTKVNTFLSFVLPYYQNILQFGINTQILNESNAKIKISRPESLAMEYSK